MEVVLSQLTSWRRENLPPSTGLELPQQGKVYTIAQIVVDLALKIIKSYDTKCLSHLKKIYFCTFKHAVLGRLTGGFF